MDQAAALTVDAVQRFASGFGIFALLNVELPPGAILVLFGPSGAGKTTILRQIAGLERPDDGRVCFGGEVWCDTARRQWRPPRRAASALSFRSRRCSRT
jgi:molybdate transport system ATP-binding protein